MKTMIYESVSLQDMINRAKRLDRFEQLGGDDGIATLYSYMEELNEPVELDIIALCCEWTHYANLADIAADYNCHYENDSQLLNWLKERTEVLECQDHSKMVRSF